MPHLYIIIIVRNYYSILSEKKHFVIVDTKNTTLQLKIATPMGQKIHLVREYCMMGGHFNIRFSGPIPLYTLCHY